MYTKFKNRKIGYFCYDELMIAVFSYLRTCRPRSAVSDCAWGGAVAPPTRYSIQLKAYLDHDISYIIWHIIWHIISYLDHIHILSITSIKQYKEFISFPGTHTEIQRLRQSKNWVPDTKQCVKIYRLYSASYIKKLPFYLIIQYQKVFSLSCFKRV